MQIQYTHGQLKIAEEAPNRNQFFSRINRAFADSA